ncbi:hypothetical protein [Sphingobacterium pedocola]|uniref:Lipoprotein n=1 Tax=Sphingobacterium pedocola TaxID=2082722 RepID=A0ABR9TAZ3_9SPHI|nr:hypothetical protein [Sphingobacterium pedocola]MBE8722503.1 hypothetical protein [Sphingobacterium pedocola]
MKRLQTKLIYCALIALLGFSVSSCKKSTDNADSTLDANLLKSAQKYDALISEREAKQGSFEIENLSRSGNILTITVKGGCKEEDFNVVWDGSVMFSSPGQINLVLYNDGADDCDTQEQLNVKVNLAKILGSHNPQNFIINVANGSKKEDVSLGTNGSIVYK